MKILVLDDSRVARRVMREALRLAGVAAVDIYEAENGRKGLDLIEGMEFNIDLVFADWNMPEMNGITFLKQLRAISPLKEIPVIMVTSQRRRGDILQALGDGAVSYIVKPFKPHTVREKLEQIQAQLRERKLDESTKVLKSIAAAAESENEALTLERLSVETRKELLQRSEYTVHEKGSDLMKPGEKVERLQFIVEGEVEVQRDGTTSLLAKGNFLAEGAFLTSTSCAFSARARSGVRLASIPKDRLGDVFRKCPDLIHYLSGVAVRQTEVRKNRPQAGVDSGLSGTLATFSITVLVQVIHSSSLGGVLHVDRDGVKARLYFDGGNLQHAVVGKRKGVEAFYEILSWDDGNFKLDPEAKEKESNIDKPTMFLLMEGARRLDESRAKRK